MFIIKPFNTMNGDKSGKPGAKIYIMKAQEELSCQIDTLIRETVDANACYRLFVDLVKSEQDSSVIFNQSKYFWKFVLGSLKEACFIRLCRIYDTTESDSHISLQKLLNLIKEDSSLLSVENFKRRLQRVLNLSIEQIETEFQKANSKKEEDLRLGRPHYISIFDRVEMKSDWLNKSIENDLDLVTNQNKIVNKLTIWRSNCFAHINYHQEKVKSCLNENPISEKEIEKMLEQSLDILNKYLLMCEGRSWISNFICDDEKDYKRLIENKL